MKRMINHFRVHGLLMLLAVMVMQACNKELPEATPIQHFYPDQGQTIMGKMDDAEFSLLKSAIVKASTFNSPTGRLSELLSDRENTFTFFAPNNTAFTISGITAAHINAMPAEQLDAIIKFHLIGGERITTYDVNPVFPNLNLYLQSTLVLAPPSSALPPGLRMPVFMGRKGTALHFNNVPVIQADIDMINGAIHKTLFISQPPTQILWERIATDPDLTYLLAAIQKADQVDASKPLESALKNPAANLTVFAPNNAAFQQVLFFQIYTYMVNVLGLDPATASAQATALASTPAVFTNPALASVLTPQVVFGLVTYHILTNRAFTVNLPATAALVPTLLNSAAVPAHPGVQVTATLGATGTATAATVRGAANGSASTILLNPTPGTGTSDQNFVNGVLHKINQVLLPQ